MVQKMEAVFDGKVLRPDTPLQLEVNTGVRLTVETLSEVEQIPRSFLHTARSMKLEVPIDWSAKLDQ